MDFLSSIFSTPVWIAILAAVLAAAVGAAVVLRRRGTGRGPGKPAGLGRDLGASPVSDSDCHLYEAAPVGILSVTADGSRVLTANAAAARLFGYATAEEFIERFVPGEAWLDGSLRQEILDVLGREGAVEGYEVPVRRADGSRRWLGLWVHLHEDRGCIEGAVMDVSTQRRMYRELRDGHLFLQSVLGAMAEPFFYLDRQGVILHVNEAMETFMGMSRAELTGKRPDDLVPAEAAGLWDDALEILLAPEGPALHDFESWLRTRGGRREIAARLGAVGDSAGRRIGAVAVLSDLTDLVRARGGLHRAEEAYRAVFEFSPQAVFATLADGRLVRANQAAAELLGYATPQEVLEAVGDVARDVYVDPARRQDVLERLAAEGQVRGLELDLKRADGGVVRAALDLRAVADADGALVRVEGLAEDVTQRMQRLRG
ncbi:PAS domain-containing protein [Desulfocurvus sp. DL9XJH121]